jgi:glycosyltransferase involved in cell wall biosynthesis
VRILYLHQFFATRESSLGLIRSYEFARRWVEQGHDVTIVTSSSRLPEEYSERLFARGEIDGIDVRSVRVTYANRMGFWRRLWSFSMFMLGATWVSLRAPRPDVVFATSTPLTVGIPGWIASALRRVPFVFEVRDLWPEAAIQMGALSRGSLLARVARSIERFLYRRAAAIVALSPGMVEGVLAEGGSPQHTHMVPNSCDLELFSPGEPDPDIVQRFELADRFVVGYAGAIGPTNALEDSVPQAARVLKQRDRDDIVFLIAGDGKSLPDLETMRTEWELENLLLVGSFPKREIPQLLRTADVLMTLFKDVPILATNSPNKFFDGIASGRPMIVNSPGWTRTLVEENDAGVFVAPGDAEALADAVTELADDPQRRSQMGANARALAEREFGRDQMAARVLGVLEDAASRGRRR